MAEQLERERQKLYEQITAVAAGEACEKLISKQQSMTQNENVYIIKSLRSYQYLENVRNIREKCTRRRGKFVAASRPVARVVGEIVGYRLYASLRCQRTQARSCPLSSSRAKATAAAGSGGDGGGCSSGVSAVYGPVYRGKIRRKGGMVVGGGTQPESGDRGGLALRVRAREGEKPTEG
ncbi:hypothetical protein ALC57_05895 [Trachymyrmex cornetzi]|uniref:Uncharacterized protein n=1 Tax=Trachymyrmex cornetzi TaxID=471704 RepID=A0A151J9R8_9HYME|nr:hypothetical protein ALC57_05895 [Trachymyrmex cornetzi]